MDFIRLFERNASDHRLQQSLDNDEIDKKFGFNRYKDSESKIGWLLNMHPVIIFKLKVHTVYLCRKRRDFNGGMQKYFRAEIS